MKPTCCLCRRPARKDIVGKPVCLTHIIALATEFFVMLRTAQRLDNIDIPALSCEEILSSAEKQGFGPLLEIVHIETITAARAALDALRALLDVRTEPGISHSVTQYRIAQDDLARALRAKLEPDNRDGGK